MSAKKVLIVDDSATERYFLSEILLKAGYEVVTAESAEGLLEKVRTDRPDIILMDIVMPGQNGFQATRAIARDGELAEIPVIICSSKGLETDRIWGLRQGAREYLVKPIVAQELLGKIAAIL